MKKIKLEGIAEERAAKVEEGIRCFLQERGVKLRHWVYQNIKDGEVCQACAVGALAASVGCQVISDTITARSGLVSDTLKAFDGLSEEDVCQLELGFEARHSGSQVWGAYGPDTVARAADPFYRLGQRLREEAK